MATFDRLVSVVNYGVLVRALIPAVTKTANFGATVIASGAKQSHSLM